MAMRVCIYCKQDVTYERENRNLLKGGAVGFWTNPLTQQAACPDAPVDANGQQLHSVGDVLTPPVDDPDALEAFLAGTYIPQPPPEPCGSMYGMSDTGEWLSCGLDKDHDGDCQAGAVMTPTPDHAAADDDGADEGKVVTAAVDMDGPNVTFSMTGDGLDVRITFDTEKTSPSEVMTVLSMFPDEARKAITEAVFGIDPSTQQAMDEAEREAERPEPVPEDLADIERFLNDE